MQNKMTEEELVKLIDQTPFVRYVHDPRSPGAPDYMFSLNSLLMLVREVQELSALKEEHIVKIDHHFNCIRRSCEGGQRCYDWENSK